MLRHRYIGGVGSGGGTINSSTSSSIGSTIIHNDRIGSKLITVKDHDNDTFDIESHDRKPSSSPYYHSNYYHKIVYHLRQLWFQLRQQIIPLSNMSKVLFVERKYTIIISLFIVILILFVLSLFVWNDGMTLYIDQSIQHHYIQYLLYQQQYINNNNRKLHSLYPNVIIKATRKLEKHHYSFYLYEIINHYYYYNKNHNIHNNKNSIATKSPSFSSSASSLLKVPSSLTVNSSIQIHGIDQINHALQLKTNKNSTKLYNNINHSISFMNQIQHWFCERCLRTGYAGSYYHCQYICSYQTIQQIYFPHTIQLQQQLSKTKDADNNNNYYDIKHLVESVQVSYNNIQSSNHKINPNQNADQNKQYQIPKIIHQVYDIPITTLLYPELVRIQNTWRTQTGYKYHFYTLNEQKQFIQQYYPNIIYNIYEAMIINDDDDDGNDTIYYQRRIHFFQLLVLYKFGGIYANLDVLLEVNLNTIIQQYKYNVNNNNNNNNVSLIVVRNPNMLLQHCIDTTFMASIPGHPIIASMIESIIISYVLPSTNLSPYMYIWDKYFHNTFIHYKDDIIQKFPIWKLYSTISLTTKRATTSKNNAKIMNHDDDCCVWGIHINHALQRHPLANLDVWGLSQPLYTMNHIDTLYTNQTKRLDEYYDTIQILMASHDDTGATRITDMERNILIASTNIIGISLDDQGRFMTVQQRSASHLL